MYDPKYDPLEHLDQMGVRLIKHTLTQHDAIWIPERRIVLLDRKLSVEHVRPVLAHECVHVEHGDPGGHHPKNEFRANLQSALRLINPTEWDTLSNTLDDYDRICLELGITRAQFLAYCKRVRERRWQGQRVERIGDIIYVNPKMGDGQWSMKLEAV